MFRFAQFRFFASVYFSSFVQCKESSIYVKNPCWCLIVLVRLSAFYSYQHTHTEREREQKWSLVWDKEETFLYLPFLGKKQQKNISQCTDNILEAWTWILFPQDFDTTWPLNFLDKVIRNKSQKIAFDHETYLIFFTRINLIWFVFSLAQVCWTILFPS